MNEGLKAITERAAKVIDAYVAEHGDQVVMSGKQIQELLLKNGVFTDYMWTIPAHCYNHYTPTTIDSFFWDKQLFEYVARGKFRLLGSNYPYNGDIIWPTRQNGHSVNMVVGKMINGMPDLWDPSRYYVSKKRS